MSPSGYRTAVRSHVPPAGIFRVNGDTRPTAGREHAKGRVWCCSHACPRAPRAVKHPDYLRAGFLENLDFKDGFSDDQSTRARGRAKSEGEVSDVVRP